MTSIGGGAFEGCSSLTSITIPESVVEIGSHAFSGCKGELTVNCNIPSVGRLDDSPFYNSNFSKVTIGDRVTSIGDFAFGGCSSLTSITIPESIDSIGHYAFGDCKRLDKVYISDIEAWCKIDFASAGSNPLCNAGKLFLNRAEVTGLTVPRAVTIIKNYAFYGCSSLTSITIFRGVTSVGDYAFYGCENLEEADIPNSVMQVGENAFGRTRIPMTEEEGGLYLSEWLIGYTDEALMSSRFVVKNGTKGIARSALEREEAPDDYLPLISVVIPTSVKHIGLNGLGYPDYICIKDIESWCRMNLAKEQHARKGLFIGSKAVKDVEIPEGIDSITYAFYKNDSINSVSIPKSTVLIVEEAFLECDNLASITFSEGSNLQSIGNSAFSGCKSLASVSIPQSTVLIGEEAFLECDNLASITFSEGSNLQSIGNSAFSGCKSLASVSIPQSTVLIGEKAFLGCDSLASVTIEGATKIGNLAFSSCKNLTSITIPENVSSIGEDAFYKCIKLTDVHISNLESWLKIDFREETHKSWIGYTESLTDTVLEGHYYSNPLAYAKNLYVNGELTKDIVIPESITEIPSGAFYQFRGLKSVVIGDNVTRIGNHAFNICEKLSSITIGKNVTEIEGRAFRDADASVYIEDLSAWCNIRFHDMDSNPLNEYNKLYLNKQLVTELVIPEDITEINEHAFRGCYSVTSVTVGDHVKSIGGHAFEDCYRLTSVNIGNGVTSIGDRAFCNCPELTSITIPDNVMTIGKTAFGGCKSLASVSLGKELTVIDESMFSNCYALTSITIPENIEEIGNRAFEACTGLQTVDLGNNVKKIGGIAFCNCSNLTSITIPESVDSIGQQAFQGCSNLKTVYCDDDIEPALCGDLQYGLYFASAFYGLDLSGCTLYVPDESIVAYKAANGWKEFGNILPMSASDVEELSVDNIKVYGGEGTLTVCGANDGTPVYVYTLNGKLLTCKIADGNDMNIAVPAGEVYIIKVADKTLKIRL